MKALCKQYLDNLAESYTLSRKNLFLSAEETDSLLAQIRENSHRTYQLRTENDALLDRIVHSRKAEDLTENDVEELLQFADELFAFVNQHDVGTAYRIHQLVYEYAKRKNDTALCIRQCYNLGISLYYLNPLLGELSVNPFGKQVTEFFTRGAEEFARFEEIDDPETRSYVIRCLTNMCMAHDEVAGTHDPCKPFDTMSTYPKFKEYFDMMMDICVSQRNRVLAPEFPWDKVIYNLHYNRSSYFMDLQKSHPPEIMRDILESAEYLYNHQEQLSNFQNSTKEARLEYIYATCRHKAGLITLDELMETVLFLVESADPNDFTANGITANLQTPLYLEQIFLSLPARQRTLYRERVDRVLAGMSSYLLRMPHNEYRNVVTHTISEAIRNRAQHALPLHTGLFDYLLFCHPPTYIHVHTAAALSRALFSRLADTAPEKLLGLYGITDTEELHCRRDELADKVYRCALYHDVGKIVVLDYIGIYTRKLLDEEFAVIKLHTDIGAALLRRLDSAEYSAVALHHHRFYDGTKGYPASCAPCPAEYKAIVDIIAVSDSIEAATDNVGRCYSVAKSFSAIISELRAESGTRYSPAVVALFDDEDFCRRLEQQLTAEREQAYIGIYGKSEQLAAEVSRLGFFPEQ